MSAMRSITKRVVWDRPGPLVPLHVEQHNYWEAP